MEEAVMAVATLGCGIVRTGVTFVVAGLLSVAAQLANAQSSVEDIERAKAASARHGTLQSHRIPATGRFEGCELQFTHAARELRTKKGELVRYSGAFRAVYAAGKALRIHLQVKASDLFIASDGQVIETPFVPAAVTLGLDAGVSMASVPAKEATCEESATCAIVDLPDFDSVMAMGQAVIGETLSMLVTTTKGGDITEIRPAKIEPVTKSGPEFARFMTCFSELLHHVSDQD